VTSVPKTRQEALAEEIIDADDGTANVGEDTGHAPSAFDESATDAATPPAGDSAARNLSIDFAYTLSLEYHKEEYCLLILQIEGRCSGALQPPHALSPTN